MVSSPEYHASGREFKSRQNLLFFLGGGGGCLVKNMRNREGWMEKTEKLKTKQTNKITNKQKNVLFSESVYTKYFNS